MKQDELIKWVVTIAIIYLLYKVIKGFKTLAVGGEYTEVTEDLQSELNKLILNGINPTITDSQASSYADFIQNTSLSANTDEKGIFDIFRVLKNNADLVLLKIKFGTRRVPFSINNVGLSAFLRSDLSNSEIQTINDILANNRIQPI
jgi:hypothetical protein